MSINTGGAAVAVKAGEQSQPQKGTATVCIGCKIPMGLVMESAYNQVKNDRGEIMLIRGGNHQAFVIKGSNAARVVGGFGITVGVPKEFAEDWFKRNADLKYVREGLIFVTTDVNAAKSEAKENRTIKSGLEPINPLEPGPGKPAVDAQARAAYLKQVAENPARGRQVDELEGAA